MKKILCALIFAFLFGTFAFSLELKDVRNTDNPEQNAPFITVAGVRNDGEFSILLELLEYRLGGIKGWRSFGPLTEKVSMSDLKNCYLPAELQEMYTYQTSNFWDDSELDSKKYYGEGFSGSKSNDECEKLVNQFKGLLDDKSNAYVVLFLNEAPVVKKDSSTVYFRNEVFALKTDSYGRSFICDGQKMYPDAGWNANVIVYDVKSKRIYQMWIGNNKAYSTDI